MKYFCASLTCFSFVWAVLWPDVARADDVDPVMASARQHFDAGKTAFASGDYPNAIREFKAAEALKPSALLQYNIGLANEKLQRRRVAVSYYKRYLAGAPNAPNRAEVEGRIANLERELGGAPSAEPPPALPPPASPPPPLAPSGPSSSNEYSLPPADPNVPPMATAEPAPPEGPYAPQSPVMAHPVVKKKSRWWIGLIVGLSIAAVVTTIVLVAVYATPNDHDRVYDAKVPALDRRALMEQMPSAARGTATAPLLQVHF